MKKLVTSLIFIICHICLAQVETGISDSSNLRFKERDQPLPKRPFKAFESEDKKDVIIIGREYFSVNGHKCYALEEFEESVHLSMSNKTNMCNSMQTPVRFGLSYGHWNNVKKIPYKKFKELQLQNYKKAVANKDEIHYQLIPTDVQGVLPNLKFVYDLNGKKLIPLVSMKGVATLDLGRDILIKRAERLLKREPGLKKFLEYLKIKSVKLSLREFGKFLAEKTVSKINEKIVLEELIGKDDKFDEDTVQTLISNIKYYDYTLTYDLKGKLLLTEGGGPEIELKKIKGKWMLYYIGWNDIELKQTLRAYDYVIK